MTHYELDVFNTDITGLSKDELLKVVSTTGYQLQDYACNQDEVLHIMASLMLVMQASIKLGKDMGKSVDHYQCKRDSQCLIKSTPTKSTPTKSTPAYQYATHLPQSFPV